MAKRRRGGSISVDVEVDVWQVIEELSDDDLLDEIAARKLDGSKGEQTDAALHEAYEELMRGRPAEATAILRGILYPKWSTVELCKKKYEAVMAKR